MQLLKKSVELAYRSYLGIGMSAVAQVWKAIVEPRMIYGYFDLRHRKYHKYVRVSSSAILLNKANLKLHDHVWIWHHTIIDSTEGVEIGEGAQVGAWVGIFTHGSESSIRLLGREFVNIPNKERRGYTRGAVQIGEYSFIGAGSIVLPGLSIGKGCLVSAATLVTKNIADFSIVRGVPGKVVGDTRDFDLRFFRDWDYGSTYYDQSALEYIKMNLSKLPT